MPDTLHVEHHRAGLTLCPFISGSPCPCLLFSAQFELDIPGCCQGKVLSASLLVWVAIYGSCIHRSAGKATIEALIDLVFGKDLSNALESASPIQTHPIHKRPFL